MTCHRNQTAPSHNPDKDARLYSPSAARNCEPIRDVFLAEMPQSGRILEIGSGTGEHAVCIARAAPALRWHAGDPDPAARASIAAHIDASGLVNIDGPHSLDVAADDWDLRLAAPLDGVVSINMIHIAPFAAAEGLFAGAAKLLRPSGRLFLYGPFSLDGAHTAASNEAFDASLKARDPRWGVRDLEHDIAPLAQNHAFRRDRLVEMPANNFVVIFTKA